MPVCLRKEGYEEDFVVGLLLFGELFVADFLSTPIQKCAHIISYFIGHKILLYEHPSLNLQPVIINATMSQNLILRQAFLQYDEECGTWRRAVGNLL